MTFYQKSIQVMPPIKLILPVKPFSSQAIMDVAWFMLPSMITMIILPLGIHCCCVISATSAPQLNPSHLVLPPEQQHFLS